jgi:lipopolysaccharide/colanic/teichoic acid biosynthesis glycosyltransferase
MQQGLEELVPVPRLLPAPAPPVQSLKELFEVRREELPHSGEAGPVAAPVVPSPHFRRGQRVLDLVLLVTTVPLVVPLALVLWLVNALVHGSARRAFFVQDRVGRGGRTFRLFKFRTMKPMADPMAAWSRGADVERVTRLGRFLRNSHLDELPQILNVVRGEMSFIGPRPEMVEVERWARAEVPGFAHQHVIRPGITGLAQITQGYVGRDREGYALKLAHNLRYVREASPALDLAIILRTVAWMLRGRGWRFRG